MYNNIFLLSAVFVPLAGSFFIPVIGSYSAKIRNLISILCCLSAFLFSCLLIPAVLSGDVISLYVRMPLGFNFVLEADMLAVFMAIVSSFISLIIIIYSFGYISHYKHQSEYYFMVILFLGAMMGIVYSSNLILLYVFWEITAFASWRLIGFFREKDYVLRADKAFLVTVFGALMMLMGFIIVRDQTGSFDLNLIRDFCANNTISGAAVLLIMFGILSKSATLPFHTWLPDAGVAPSPVTALLHAAVLVKIGVYVFARLFIVTFSYAEIWNIIIPYIAAISALVSAGAALVETDIKRIIAYSTVSQIAFIFLGLTSSSGIGVAGAMLYILMHGLAKGGLFLCAGIVEQNTKTKDIRKMGGLIYAMPVTAISFIICAFSVMGVPPFGGFFCKYMVFAGSVNSGHIFISFIFLIGAFLTIMYLLRLFNAVFLGEVKIVSVKEGSRIMIASVATLAIITIFSGILIYYPSSYLQTAIKQMLKI